MTATDLSTSPIKISSFPKKEEKRCKKKNLLSVTDTTCSTSKRVPFQLIQEDDHSIRIQQVDEWFQEATGVKVGQRVAMLQDRDIESYQDMDEIRATLQGTLEINLVVKNETKKKLSTKTVSSTNTQSPCNPQKESSTNITDDLELEKAGPECQIDVSTSTMMSETSICSKSLVYGIDSSERHIMDQSQLQMQAELVASLESKLRMQEEQTSMYKGMYEDLQEDYKKLYQEYHDEVEENATMLRLMKRMEECLRKHENALNEKTKQINNMKEQLSILRQTGNQQSLKKLEAENKQLQEMVYRQKQSLFKALSS